MVLAAGSRIASVAELDAGTDKPQQVRVDRQRRADGAPVRCGVLMLEHALTQLRAAPRLHGGMGGSRT
eukprot:1353872-Rhodomonas_salina.1